MNARFNSSTEYLTCFFGEHLSLNYEIQPLLTQPWLSHPAHHGSIFSQGGEQPTKTWHKILAFLKILQTYFQGNNPTNRISQDATGSLRQHTTHFSYYSNNVICSRVWFDPSLTAGCINQEQEGCDCEHSLILRIAALWYFRELRQVRQGAWGQEEAAEPKLCGQD